MEILEESEINYNNFDEKIIYRIAHVYSMIEREIEEYLKPFNLSPAKFNILAVIKYHGKDTGLGQTEKSEHLVVTASNIAKLLDKLNNEGLIQRYEQKGDRRKNLIKTTQKGSELIDEIWPGYCKKVKEITGFLDKNELKQLSIMLEKWFNSWKDYKNLT